MGLGRADTENPGLRLRVFISRTLWSWPSHIEEVVPFVLPFKLISDGSSKMTRKLLPCRPVWVNMVYRIMDALMKQQVLVWAGCCVS